MYGSGVMGGWRSDALCLTDPNPDAWISQRPSDVKYAVRRCEACPVMAACREWTQTLVPAPNHGVWGGLPHYMLASDLTATTRRLMCGVCGKKFIRGQNIRTPRAYCSDECSLAARKACKARTKGNSRRAR